VPPPELVLVAEFALEQAVSPTATATAAATTMSGRFFFTEFFLDESMTWTDMPISR
jgi:hypothetical protein